MGLILMLFWWLIASCAYPWPFTAVYGLFYSRLLMLNVGLPTVFVRLPSGSPTMGDAACSAWNCAPHAMNRFDLAWPFWHTAGY